ncbi:MAG: sugar phosphate isomerase/epimerase family protein [Kiritimatiellia bacterium]|jgi:sugar phosphate isomerase/epimerase|nr:sugar phosphate isomerase/epimerase family protein [Kiritimatiellia bacterium]
MHCNCITEVRIARDLGYGGIEFLAAKIERYLDVGHRIETLAEACRQAGTPAVCINALADADRLDTVEHSELLAECERLCSAAEALGCPTVQLVFRERLAGRPWPEVRRLTAENAAKLADIGKGYSVRFQLEPLAWAPMHGLSQSLEVIEEAARDNLGMVIDFWHLWAGGATGPEEVARLDKRMIYGVHFCDGKRKPDLTVDDEGELRAYLPGDGDIPIKEWVGAVLATGYDGAWSAETYSPRHWELDLYNLSRECKERMERYIVNV